MLEELREKIEARRAEAERKRDELLTALHEGRVRDPFSSSIILSILISTAISAATAGLTYLITPRQRLTQGDRGGQEFQIQRAQQGTPIPEVFGADPGDGLGGGVKVAPILAWLSRDAQGNVARKHEQQSRGGGGGKGPKPPEVTTVTYDLDVLLMWARGPLVLKKLWAGTKVIYRPYSGGVDFYQAENGTRAGGATVITDGLASGGQAVSIPQNGSVTFTSIPNDGTPVILEFYLKSTIENSVEMNFVGDVFPDTVDNTGGVYALGYQSLPFIFQSSSNSVTIKNLSSTAVVVDRLGIRVSGGATGVPAAGVVVDDGYDAVIPHAPTDPYTRPTARFSGELLDDGSGGMAGTIQAGAYAGIAIYEGNGTELPDPVVQAAIDAQYGEGSTPAYRNYATTRLANFYLSDFQEVFPPMAGLLEHKTLKTLADIFGHLCERVGLTSDDYDFSDLTSINVRGVVVSPPYAPKELMTTLARVYGVYFYESDKIYGLRYSSAPTFSLSDSDLGWVDDDSEDEGVLPELAGSTPVETDIPRRVTVKYLDPERSYGDNSQNEPRQVTTGQREEVLEVFVVMTASEAREAAQRELYREDVEATTHSFSLSYGHIYRNPGDVATITRTEGFTHQVRITSIKPAIGAIECEGVAIDTAAYTQPVSTDAGGFEIPPVRIPGQTLAFFYDGPLLRDTENTINNGLGIYVGAVKRYGDGDFTGSALYVDRDLGYELIAQFTKQAIFGVTASVLTASTNAHDVVADALTVDLHNPDDIIESHARADLLAGAGACIVGDEVCQILSATREPDTATYPNRWYLVIGLRARRGTDFAISTHATGERFAFIDDALQFVPLNVNEKNVTRNYKMVSGGQSLDDAAVVQFTFTAGSVKSLAPVNVHRRDDSAGNQLWEWSDRDRLGHGLHGGLSGFDDPYPRRFEIDVWPNSSRTTLKRTIPVSVGAAQAAVIIGNLSAKFTNVTVNTLSTTASIRGRTLQQITQAGNFVEGAITIGGGGLSAGEQAGFGLIRPEKDWRSPGTFSAYNIAEFDYFVELYNAAPSGVRLLVYKSGVQVYSNSITNAPTKIRIILSGSEVRFVRDWVGAGTSAFYVGAAAPSFPYHVGALIEGDGAATSKIEKLVLTTDPDPKTIYSLAQQIEDFGSAQTTIYADIYRLDERGGRGYPARVTLTNEG